MSDEPAVPASPGPTPSPKKRRGGFTGTSDRIWPLADPGGVHALLQGVPPSGIYDHGGGVLANVETTAVFIGSQWGTDPTLAGLPGQLEQFLTWFVASPLIAELVEYGAPGPGTNNPRAMLTGQAVASPISDVQIENILASAITNGALPAGNANSVYVAFLPNGIEVDSSIAGTSCVNQCGYHSNIQGQNGFPYAAIAYPSCVPQCRPAPLSAFQALTTTTSHEVREAMTNPHGDTWFRNSDQAEIGDLCLWKTKTEGIYTVQLIWSNSTSGGSCI